MLEAQQSQRVAVLSHSHHSLTKGGAEIAAHTLFAGLRAIGIDAILIACCDEMMLDRVALGRHEFAITYRAERYDHFYHLSTIDIRRQLLDILRRERIDVLNAHHFLHTGSNMFEDVAAAGVRIVFTFHEFLSLCHNHGQLVTRGPQSLCDGPSPTACHACYAEHTRQQFAIRARGFADAFTHVDAFVSPSHFLAGRMAEHGIPSDRIKVIENGLAWSGSSTQPEKSAQRTLPEKSAQRTWTFGYFGQINPFKGIGVILGACAILAREPAIAQRIHIAVHGNVIALTDAFLERFAAAVEEYPFLSYSGAYDNAQVGSLMATCDYVVVPSTWWENSPVVIQEAFRARCPVICTGIGGMAEKVTDRVNGFHFARNDSADLAARILEAANDDALYAQLQAGIPVTLTAEDMAVAYADVFGAAAVKRS